MNIGVFVSGGGTNLQAIIDRVADGSLPGVTIKAVVSTSEKAFALERAKRHGIDRAVFPKRRYADAAEREKEILSFLNARDVDWVVLAGCLMVFSREFIEAFGGRIINIHPALLPDFGGKGFYGLRVHEAVLRAGVAYTGATVHYVVPEIDAGPVILQKRVPVLPGDTPETLQRRVMAEAEQVILPEAIRMISEGKK